MLDLSVAYNRYRFLGDEFLTWLWHLIETDSKIFKTIDSECSAIEVGNRMVIENRKGTSVERISIKGEGAGLEEGKIALRKGSLVTELALVFKTGEHQWQFSIKGESFGVSRLKVPGPAFPQSPEETEDFLLDKVQRTVKIMDFIDNLFKIFIKLRISTRWSSKTLPSMNKWLYSGV